jgi:hypothetical protein
VRSGAEHADVVASELGIGCQQAQVLDRRLSDEQSIEGVAMMVTERRDAQRMSEISHALAAESNRAVP